MWGEKSIWMSDGINSSPMHEGFNAATITLHTHTHNHTHKHTPAAKYSEAQIVGCLTQRLRNTMTVGHLAVMEPFVCGNSHFPVWSQDITAEIWNPVILFSFLSISERRRFEERNRKKGREEELELEQGACFRFYDCHCHSNVLLQGWNLQGEWEMNTNGNQMEEGIIGFNYVCQSRTGYNLRLKWFWHCHNVNGCVLESYGIRIIVRILPIQ